jgi:hypothetical protein
MIPDSSDLAQQIEQIAETQGFKMEVDQDRINEMQKDNQYVGSNYAESYSPNNSYLHAVQHGANLDKLYVDIYKEGKATLSCTINGQYGEQKTPDTGKAILHFELSLPER